MSVAGLGQKRSVEQRQTPTTIIPPDFRYSEKAQSPVSVEMISDDTESLQSDESIITCCKRARLSLPDRKRPTSHGIELGDPPLFTRVKTTDCQDSSNEGSDKLGVLEPASKWQCDYCSLPASNIPVYGCEYSSPHTKQGVANPVSTGTTNDGIPISPPRKTMGKPSVGEFKPHKFASDKGASPKPRVPRPKAFDLSQNPTPQLIALDTPNETLRAAKRQKIGPDKSVTTDLTVDDNDLYKIRRNKNPRSSEDSGTVTKSVQSLGSRPQEATLNTLGGVPEYKQLQKLVGFPSNMETKKQDRIAKQSSPFLKNGSQQKGAIFSKRVSNFVIDEDDDLRAQPPSATGYIGIASLDPQIARNRYRQNNGRILEGSSGYFKSNGRNNNTQNSSSRLIRNSPELLRPADKRSVEINDEEEDSMDQLAEGHDTARDKNFASQHRDFRISSRTTGRGLSGSVLSGGNIPQSAFSKAHSNTRRNGSNFQGSECKYRLASIQSELWTWPLEGTKEDQKVWELRLNAETKVFEPFKDDSLFEDLPGLYINPQQVNRVRWAEDSGMIVVNRSCGAGVSSMLLLEIIFSSSGHFVQGLQHINAGIKCVSMPKSELVKIFLNMEKKFNQQQANSLDKAGRQSSDIELLESNQAHRNNVQSHAKPHRRISVQELAGLDNFGQRQTLAQNMNLNTQSSSKILQVVHNLDPTPNDPDEIHGFAEGNKPETRSAARNSAGQQKPRRSPSPLSWTELNPGWKNERAWVSSLVYPSDAKKRTTVDQDDIRRLDKGEFLNDNLIEFYLRYLEHNLEKTNPETAKRIYFQNTFFYEALTKGKVRSNNINYDAVKRWTAKVDLFEYDYIVVPVNEKMHWYLAIICNAPNLIRTAVKGIANSQESHDADTQVDTELIKTESYQQDGQDANDLAQIGSLRKIASSDSMSQKVENMSLEDKNGVASEWPSSEQSYKLVAFNKKIDDDGLDNVETDDTTTTHQCQSPKVAPKGRKLKRKSMGRKYDIDDTRIITMDSLGLSHSPACSNLREYLICEARERYGIDISVTKLGMTAKNIPQQTNYCDCGLFVLGYIEKFLENPEEFTRLILRGEMNVKTHWAGMKASRKREDIRELLFYLQNEQIQRQQEERKARRSSKITGKPKNLDLTTKSDQTASSNSSSTAVSPSQLPMAVAQSDISEPLEEATDTLETGLVEKSSGGVDNPSSALLSRSKLDKRSRETTPHEVDKDVVDASVSPKKSSANAGRKKFLLESRLDPDKLPKAKAASPPCKSRLGFKTQTNNLFKKFRISNADDEPLVSSPPRHTGASRSYPVEIDDSFEGVAEEPFNDLLADHPQSLNGPRHPMSPRLKTSTASSPMRTRSSPRTNQHISFADGIYMTEDKRGKRDKPEVKGKKTT